MPRLPFTFPLKWNRRLCVVLNFPIPPDVCIRYRPSYQRFSWTTFGQLTWLHCSLFIYLFICVWTILWLFFPVAATLSSSKGWRVCRGYSLSSPSRSWTFPVPWLWNLNGMLLYPSAPAAVVKAHIRIWGTTNLWHLFKSPHALFFLKLFPNTPATFDCQHANLTVADVGSRIFGNWHPDPPCAVSFW